MRIDSLNVFELKLLHLSILVSIKVLCWWHKCLVGDKVTRDCILKPIIMDIPFLSHAGARCIYKVFWMYNLWAIFSHVYIEWYYVYMREGHMHLHLRRPCADSPLLETRQVHIQFLNKEKVSVLLTPVINAKWFLDETLSTEALKTYCLYPSSHLEFLLIWILHTQAFKAFKGLELPWKAAEPQVGSLLRVVSCNATL